MYLFIIALTLILVFVLLTGFYGMPAITFVSQKGAVITQEVLVHCSSKSIRQQVQVHCYSKAIFCCTIWQNVCVNICLIDSQTVGLDSEL